MNNKKGAIRFDCNTNNFDMRSIENCRFMFHPATGTLILGQDGKLDGSHAEEFGETGCEEDFDAFIRGWVGTGGDYPNGVIHFAPNIPKECVKLFDKAYSTLEMFRANGMDKKCIIRGLGDTWEQPFNNLSA